MSLWLRANRCARAVAATLACCLASLTVFAPCLAADRWLPEQTPVREAIMIQASPKVVHFDPDPEYVGWSWLAGIEWNRPTRWLYGFAYFNNSFGQKCQYYYAGYVWKLSDRYPSWYFKLTGGLIYGYKEPYGDKVPFNKNGYSPGIIPALGYKQDRWNIQLNTLGTAGLMFTIGYDILVR